VAPPIKPLAIWGVVNELRRAATDERALAVDGARELAGALRRELARHGDPAAIVGADELERAAALVYVVAAPPTEDDERTLKAARRARTPVVGVVAAPGVERLPYVLPTDVVRVPPGAGFPLEEIARVLAHRLGESATPLAARLPVLRDAVSRELISSFSRKNGIVGVAVFLPGADLPVLTLNQIRLVLRIAAAHGVEVDAARLPEVLGVVGAGLGFRTLAREALGMVPVAGWLLKGAVAYAGTKAVGEAAMRRFAGVAATPQRDLASPDEP
jgi:uncharacterized protein (DUF697 family)